jgi:hypothetical protein
MTFNTSSAVNIRILSWVCALSALILLFGLARVALHRLPIVALLIVAGFKFLSMFYVAGRLIEQTWVSVSRLTLCSLQGAGDQQDAPRRSKSLRPLKSRRDQMTQVRQAHAARGRNSEAAHG